MVQATNTDAKPFALSEQNTVSGKRICMPMDSFLFSRFTSDRPTTRASALLKERIRDVTLKTTGATDTSLPWAVLIPVFHCKYSGNSQYHTTLTLTLK